MRLPNETPMTACTRSAIDIGAAGSSSRTRAATSSSLPSDSCVMSARKESSFDSKFE